MSRRSKTCNGCGGINRIDALFCQECGSELASASPSSSKAVHFCPNCGQKLPGSITNCGKCGYRFGQNAAANPPPHPSQLVIVRTDSGSNVGTWFFLTILLIGALLIITGYVKIPDNIVDQISNLRYRIVAFIQDSQTTISQDSSGSGGLSSTGVYTGETNTGTGADQLDEEQSQQQPPSRDGVIDVQPEPEENPPARDGVIEVQPEVNEDPPARDGIIEVQPYPADNETITFTFVNNTDECISALWISPSGGTGPSLIDSPIFANGGSAVITMERSPGTYDIAAEAINCIGLDYITTYFKISVPINPDETYSFRPY